MGDLGRKVFFLKIMGFVFYLALEIIPVTRFFYLGDPCKLSSSIGDASRVSHAFGDVWNGSLLEIDKASPLYGAVYRWWFFGRLLSRGH